MAAFSVGFEFDFMARRPMYARCPRWLIDNCRVDKNAVVVDLGCGSGLLTELLLRQFRDAPNFRVIAIDPSEFELSIARKRISDARVTFILGRAQDALQIIDSPPDAVLLCNVLHQIPLEERQSVLKGALALMRTRGWVGANTLFYDGGLNTEARAFQVRWLAEAREYLAKKNVRFEPNLTSVALQRLTPQGHYDLFASAGFEDIRVEELQFDWQVEDWEALSRYSVFIHGALSSEIDLGLGSRALIAGARAAYRALGINTVRRGWLHVVGRRP